MNKKNDKDVNRNLTEDKRSQKTGKKFTIKMQKKLVVLFCLVLLAFAGLSIRLMWISREKGDQYSKQVLSQQKYDSITLPFRRGDILDQNGTSLAVSEKVYNLVIDSKIMLGKDGTYLEPTLSALSMCFPDLDITAVRTYVESHTTNSYYVPLKKLAYNQISDFLKIQNDKGKDEAGNLKPGNFIKGIWFEEEYKRTYPNGTLACDAIGFTTSDGTGMYGLEEYYNDILNGSTGREYGYLNGDSSLERTTKPATDGNTLVSTLDVNIQSTVEKYIKEFSDEYTNNYTEGPCASNVGCIVMEVNTGNILAMASYPVFDLNTPFDLSTYYSDDEVAAMKENDTYYDTLNSYWRNYCISDTFEPGSTYKPFTVAMGLETGILHGNETYECNGFLEIGGHKIKCHNRYGDGIVSIKKSISSSCNVALMKMASAIGTDTFAEYQKNFSFGLKSGIDLAGEARTAELLYPADKMGSTDLAIGSFGQGFNVTMIQMISGFSSLVNGGYYYEPHLVSQIRTTGGAIVENIEPRVLKQTISESTSSLIREYCQAVCDPDVPGNTGKTARPAGYAIGGKTGTAETLPRGNKEYVVSFIGYAPADNPQIAIYVVIDRPNMQKQDLGTRCATGIARDVMSEVLPYMGIFMTEELSEKEVQELAEKKLEDTTKYAQTVSDGNTDLEEPSDDTVSGGISTEPAWKNFATDPATGYLIDPATGELLDPETGDSMEGNYVTIPE
ncbi:MAG TPA: penicillin-binding transpeptidase domain-containing protein [Lachnospiraceae bacterium]|nr:penicillin-binding transpeptidase domain-containing protein [Lachnospiraceae bacterium]